MKNIRKFILSMLMLSGSAFANTFGTDLSDIWWRPAESGWGVTAVHQGDVVFLTFFVYGPDNRPVWFTSTTTYRGQNGQGAADYSGPLYETTGPWLGKANYNAEDVRIRQVGNVTFTAQPDAATLNYDVDGAFVSKQVVRQTFRLNDLTADYAGILMRAGTGCISPINSGSSEKTVAVEMSNSISQFAMTLDDGTRVCKYTGDYKQNGRLGSSQGTYTCPGVSGTYALTEIEASPSALSAKYSASDNLCQQYSGKFAGIKR